MKFHRAGTISVEEGIGLVRAHMKKSKNCQRKRVEVLGHDVALNSLRLYTFASTPTCCSNPECSVRAAFFAVEIQTKDGNPVNSHYQLNMYGRNAQGHEVLMTHDHTLARSLGGVDGLGNTTTMCQGCNKKKSIFESQEIERRRAMERGVPMLQAPPPTLKSAAFLADFARMATSKGMTEGEYREHCALHGTALGPPLSKWEDRDREQAKSMGLTRVALRLYQKHLDEALRPGVELVLEAGDVFDVDPSTLAPIRHRKRPHH